MASSVTLFLLTTLSLCAAEQLPRAWIGESPACKGNWYKCEPFNMDFVRLDASGDGAACWTGWKALCQLKNIPFSPKTTPTGTLKILTYNVFERPWVATHDGQVERTCRIPETLYSQHSDVDVIVFQEAFLGGCTPEMTFKRILPHYGWPYVTNLVGLGCPVNGGVMIASKHLLEDVHYHVYSHSTFGTADYYSGKGFIYAKFKKDGVSHHIIGTHLQAQEGASESRTRFNQFGEIKEFLEKKYIPSSDLLYLAGDLNFDGFHHPSTIHNLFSVVKMEPIEFTKKSQTMPSYDPATNDVVEPGESPATYDYVGYRNSYRISNASQEVLRLKYPTKFRYCNGAKLSPYWVYWQFIVCNVVKETVNFSDHYPVLATIHYDV